MGEGTIAHDQVPKLMQKSALRFSYGPLNRTLVGIFGFCPVEFKCILQGSQLLFHRGVNVLEFHKHNTSHCGFRITLIPLSTIPPPPTLRSCGICREAEHSQD